MTANNVNIVQQIDLRLWSYFFLCYYLLRFSPFFRSFFLPFFRSNQLYSDRTETSTILQILRIKPLKQIHRLMNRSDVEDRTWEKQKKNINIHTTNVLLLLQHIRLKRPKPPIKATTRKEEKSSAKTCECVCLKCFCL